LAILPGGAAIIAVPVGIAHIIVGNVWAGVLIILGTVTFVSALANQVRPLLISKDAYLNRAFVLLSVFSGIAIFGFMGIIYGPLIMILFTTVLEGHLTYYRPQSPPLSPATNLKLSPQTRSPNKSKMRGEASCLLWKSYENDGSSMWMIPRPFRRRFAIHMHWSIPIRMATKSRLF